MPENEGTAVPNEKEEENTGLNQSERNHITRKVSGQTSKYTLILKDLIDSCYCGSDHLLYAVNRQRGYVLGRCGELQADSDTVAARK